MYRVLRKPSEIIFNLNVLFIYSINWEWREVKSKFKSHTGTCTWGVQERFWIQWGYWTKNYIGQSYSKISCNILCITSIMGKIHVNVCTVTISIGLPDCVIPSQDFSQRIDQSPVWLCVIIVLNTYFINVFFCSRYFVIYSPYISKIHFNENIFKHI